MRFKLAMLFAAAALFAAAPVFAGTVTFNFDDCSAITSSHSGSCPDADLGTPTATYTVGTYSITATGYISTTQTNDLWVKDDGASEDGLGLAGTTSNEINSGQYIYLNMSNLLSQGISTAAVGFGSLQSGESGQVCESTAVGTPGSLNCQTVTESGTSEIGSANVSFSSTDPILAFTVPPGGSGNFLIINSVSVTPPSASEASSLVLSGLALLGLGLVSWRLRGAEA